METLNVKDNKDETFPAIVVKIIDAYTVVINRGTLHNIKEGQRFLIFQEDEQETTDPITGESLGHLEIIKGTGKVLHVQEKIATIKSDVKMTTSQRKIVRKRSSIFTLPEQEEELIMPSETLASFENVQIKDKAKPI